MLKFPLRLPICPACGARFLYTQTNQVKKVKTVSCPHCKKKLSVCYKKEMALLFLAAIVLLIGLNDLIMFVVSYINLLGLFVVTAIGLCITYFLIPYTVRLKL